MGSAFAIIALSGLGGILGCEGRVSLYQMAYAPDVVFLLVGAGLSSIVLFCPQTKTLNLCNRPHVIHCDHSITLFWGVISYCLWGQ
jgi:hypothetical protein